MMENNSDKYRFSDFTFESYEQLLAFASKNYRVTTYSGRHDFENGLIWRHDVDFSPYNALRFAQIEHKLGVKAIYFFLLHSEFYNLLEQEITDIVKQIKSLGHEIQLHFDSHFYKITSSDELEKYLEFEKNIFKQVFEVDVSCFSFHITNEFTMNCDAETYGGMLNVYSKSIKTDFLYCSDSYGIWRFDNLNEFLNKHIGKKVQVLTHPELWSSEIKSPKQRVWDCIHHRSDNTKLWYDNFLSKNGREHIDWQ